MTENVFDLAHFLTERGQDLQYDLYCSLPPGDDQAVLLSFVPPVFILQPAIRTYSQKSHTHRLTAICDGTECLRRYSELLRKEGKPCAAQGVRLSYVAACLSDLYAHSSVTLPHTDHNNQAIYFPPAFPAL